MDEDGARDAARLARIGQCDVVGDDDHFDREAQCLGALGGEAEIEPVAGVVLDDEEAARGAGDGDDGGEHRIDAGRGEDIAADGGGQQSRADEAGMGGLVARPAARDDRDLGLVPAGAQHDPGVTVPRKANEPAATRGDQPVDRFIDDVGPVVVKRTHALDSRSRSAPLAAHFPAGTERELMASSQGLGRIVPGGVAAQLVPHGIENAEAAGEADAEDP